MLIIVYLLDIASDVTNNKEHTPLSPLKRGIRKVVKTKERISHGDMGKCIFEFLNT
ncbi:MAG TPA: hypothetical protein PKY56_00730 [Candidatus Kapabacteria bacterium]|nr:hypothetical protein [Candidatus Kapabacteria bacterium]